MVKKWLVILSMAMLVFGVAGCGVTNDEKAGLTEKDTASVDGVSESEAAFEKENTKAESDAKTDKSDKEEPMETGKILVAYFSATGTTKKLAEYTAEVMGADLYEIVPEEPYSDADLDWHDSNSRTSIEMNDASIKPAISGSVADMGQYDIVFIGYPIWWGDSPRIMSTFVESYDFSGKTIVPFCTSGSSGIGSSATNLHPLVSKKAVWKKGKRFGSGATKDEISAWINSLSLGIEVKEYGKM